MAETDILNPTQEFWAAIKDSPNPSYGYERRTASNTAVAKARLGAPYTRDTLNDGFAFALRYDNRPWAAILRMKHFYEQFKRGYFTYIDYDGGGRHHVGRFTTPINAQHLAHASYGIQQVIFQEIPQARMLEYPADFVNWSATINVLDDALYPTVATYSVAPGAWATQFNPTVAAPSATDPSAYEVFNANPTFYSTSPANYDWAQVQYVGWGFQMQLRTALNLGWISIQVDGVYLGTFDLSTGTNQTGVGYVPCVYANGLLTVTKMPLDTHRVLVQAYGPSAGGGKGVIFPPITVIV